MGAGHRGSTSGSGGVAASRRFRLVPELRLDEALERKAGHQLLRRQRQARTPASTPATARKWQ